MPLPLFFCLALRRVCRCFAFTNLPHTIAPRNRYLRVAEGSVSTNFATVWHYTDDFQVVGGSAGPRGRKAPFAVGVDVANTCRCVIDLLVHAEVEKLLQFVAIFDRRETALLSSR